MTPDSQRDPRLEAARINQSGSIDARRLERVVGELALATKTLQRLMIDKGVCTHDGRSPI
ncbi:MAG: hypothetical protein O3A25_12125 [Acidobacteria bacterium]|nr:hypothetical protein [Acidobacteriota bacterium]